MTMKPNGGPAFPVPNMEQYAGFNGMTLRDYFAGQALAGFTSGTFWCDLGDVNECANACYEQADAMIAAREVQL